MSNLATGISMLVFVAIVLWLGAWNDDEPKNSTVGTTKVPSTKPGYVLAISRLLGGGLMLAAGLVVIVVLGVLGGSGTFGMLLFFWLLAAIAILVWAVKAVL